MSLNNDELSLILSFISPKELLNLRFINKNFNSIIIFLQSFLLIYGNKLTRYHISINNNLFVHKLIKSMEIYGIRINFNKIINCALYYGNISIMKYSKKKCYEISFKFLKNKNLKFSKLNKIISLFKFSLSYILEYAMMFENINVINEFINLIPTLTAKSQKHEMDINRCKVMIGVYNGDLKNLMIYGIDRVTPIFSPNCDFKKIIDQLILLDIKIIHERCTEPDVYEYITRSKNIQYSFENIRNQKILNYLVSVFKENQLWTQSKIWKNQLCKKLINIDDVNIQDKYMFRCWSGNFSNSAYPDTASFPLIAWMIFGNQLDVYNNIKLFLISKQEYYKILSLASSFNRRKFTLKILENFDKFNIPCVPVHHNSLKTMKVCIDFIEKRGSVNLKCFDCEKDFDYHKKICYKNDF